MVITVEPGMPTPGVFSLARISFSYFSRFAGVYVPPDPTFPKAFHNIGIRLEDDILVKRNHAVRLTANAPLEIADVEGTCQGLVGVGPY